MQTQGWGNACRHGGGNCVQTQGGRLRESDAAAPSPHGTEMVDGAARVSTLMTFQPKEAKTLMFNPFQARSLSRLRQSSFLLLSTV